MRERLEFELTAQTRYTIRVALTVALGGFLMGFDASVISGVVTFIEPEFDLTKMELGWAVASCRSAKVAYATLERLERVLLFSSLAALLGALIVGFLVLEPHGLAHLWRLAKDKLRTWPFPY